MPAVTGGLWKFVLGKPIPEYNIVWFNPGDPDNSTELYGRIVYAIDVASGR